MHCALRSCWRSRPCGSTVAFAAYAAQREALSHALFEITDAIASFTWNLDTVRQRHLELNTAMKHEVEHVDRHIIDHRNSHHAMGADDLPAASSVGIAISVAGTASLPRPRPTASGRPARRRPSRKRSTKSLSPQKKKSERAVATL
jgi:hypothetical protein